MAQFNISGALTQKLFAEGDGGTISSIWFCNRHASDAVTIDLYIEKKLTGRFYYLKNQSVSVKNFLQIENININVNDFGLYIKLNNSDSEVDIITQ